MTPSHSKRQAARSCAVCGKGPTAGRKIKRRGMARIKGGAGRKITGVTARWFRPNLQTIRTLVDGAPRRILVCAKCLKTGRIQKYVPHARPAPHAAV